MTVEIYYDELAHFEWLVSLVANSATSMQLQAIK